MKLRPILYIIAGAIAMTPLQAVSQKKGNTATQSMQLIASKTIAGTVLDENGEPLAGATVRIEGTQQGVATDIDGNFSILSDKKNPTIVISYVGMETFSTKLNGEAKYLQIKLKPVANLMDEVVVTGYQNIKRENATGSYQIIKAEDMDKRYTGDITSNLEGKIPGVVYNPKSSSQDENAITIRGTSTFSAKKSPLVVVDGLPIEGGMNTVNPYDIENITILKDAAAAAIYGARASNGVIVITSKKAKEQKISVDFNADLQISEKMNYDNYNWASAADLIQLEKYNFNAMLQNNPKSIQDNFNMLDRGKANKLSKVMRVLLENNRGNISDAEMNSTFDQWSRNDYMKEYQDVHDRTNVSQQYNLALRVNGKSLSSNIVVNWSGNNGGIKGYDNSSLSIKYLGDLKVASWMDLTFNLNVLNNRTKGHELGSYGYRTSFLPYESMYNPDGTYARMEADIYPGEASLDNPEYELKDVTYNVAEEIEKGYNPTKYRYTNVRTNIMAFFRLPVQGWTAQAQFQYEDIFSKNQTQYSKNSQYMRSLFNRYTTSSSVTEWVDDPNWSFDDWDGDFDHIYKKQITINKITHNIPDGDALTTRTLENQFYTFRAQTRYNRQFLGKHDVDFLAGFEYRQTHTSWEKGGYYGYDRQTTSNLNMQTNWQFINTPTVGVMGSEYTPLANSGPVKFATDETLHRYYSYYFTGNYVFDSRYSLSGSYRVDKADLFGTDPKFRGKPLWSVGASWNAHNEEFMRPYTWINALKLRASYGLTGNIDNSVSSYLTATLNTNMFGSLQGTLDTPPNDQLRWEKTATWNAGIDFGFFGYRLAGTFDFYRKNGSDILTSAELDPTTGWTSQTINSAKMTNTGVELQLDGQILPARKRSDLGISLGFNIAYNKNKVTELRRFPASANDFLNMTYHKGYPLNSLFSIDYAGLIDKDGTIFVGWYDHNGEIQTTSTSSSTFTMDDIIFSGTTTPKISGSLTPEIKWNGFSLSAMLAFYGGHYMRTDNDAWDVSVTQGTSGYRGAFGYTSFSRDLLRYFDGEAVPANGYMAIRNGNNISAGRIRNTAIEHADYMKFRNIILTYNFDKKICKKIGLNDLRLRFQMNNIATWARNGLGIDPEAYNLSSGRHIDKTPRSYTMSLFFNL